MDMMVPLPVWSVFDFLIRKWMPSLTQETLFLVGWILDSNLPLVFRVYSLTLRNPKKPNVKAAFNISLSCLLSGSLSSSLSCCSSISTVRGSLLGLRWAGPWEHCMPLMARFSVGLL